MPAPPVPAAEAARLRLQRQRIRRWAMVFIYGVPLLLLAGACYVAFGPKPPPPPKPILVSPQRAAVATQNIDAVRQALTQPVSTPEPAPTLIPSPKKVISAVSGPSAPAPVQVIHPAVGPDLVTMRVSQADLNAYLSTNPKIKALLAAKGVQAVSVTLSPPANISILAAATFKGITGNAEVDAVMEPDPATAIHLNIQDARFGRLPSPVVVAAVNQIMAHLTGAGHGSLPLTVTAVTVDGSDLVLKGVRKTALPRNL